MKPRNMGKTMSQAEEHSEQFDKINRDADSYIEYIKSEVEKLHYDVEMEEEGGHRFDIIKVKNINNSNLYLLLNKNTKEIASSPYKYKEEAESCREELEKESL